MRPPSERSRAARFAIAIVLVALASSLPATARAEDPADALFREGAEAVHENKIPLAYEKFKAAWAIRQTFDIAANLGAVEKAIGKLRDAAEHLDYALRHFPPMNTSDQRKEIETDLAEIKKQVGELTIVSATGATIDVNGKPVGVCPLPAPIFVDPGQQIIVARKPEIGEGKIVVTVRVGEAQEVRVELTLDEKPKGSGPTETATPRPMWPGFVGIGVGAAGIGVGIAGFVLSATAQSDADDAAAQLTAGDCPANALCQELQSSLDDVADFRTMGIVGMAVGGAAALFGIVYLAIPNPGTDDKTSAQITPWLAPGTGGFIASGTF